MGFELSILEHSVVANPATTPLKVAEFFLFLAEQEEEPTYLTPLSLQKLLYYAQGWTIVERSIPLFNESIEAWAYGPVVPSVWKAYQGKKPILRESSGPASLEDDDGEIVRSVWERYKRFSPIALSEMTHSEPPWKAARGLASPGTPSGRPISLQTLREFFGERMKSAQDQLIEQWDEVLDAARENTERLRKDPPLDE